MRSTKVLLIGFGALLSACESGNPSQVGWQTRSTLETHGQERGNGAELIMHEDGSAWFARKDRTITTCYELAIDLGVPALEVEETIQWAFDTWSKYIRDKKLNRDRFGFATAIQLRSSCKGDEDLKFRLGEKVQEIERRLKGTRKSVAQAVRTSYDPHAGWGKGYVWVASHGALGKQPNAETSEEKVFPDWSMSNALKGIILHEVGHIFGNEHVYGTIMEEEIVRYIRHVGPSLNDYRDARLTRIAFSSELYVCTDCAFNQPGELGLAKAQGYYPALDKRTQNFFLLTGKYPTGEVTASFERSEGGQERLTVKDSKSSYEFELKPKPGAHWTETKASSVFKIVLANRWGIETNSQRAVASARWLTLTTATGHDLSVQLQRNMNGSIRALDSTMAVPFDPLLNLFVDRVDRVDHLFTATYWN